MSSNKCPVCGEHGYIYFEGFTNPDWEEKHYTDREKPVGYFFCTVEHLLRWLEKQGYNLSEAINNVRGDVVVEWTEKDEMGTEQKVRVIDRSERNELEINTFHPEPGIMGSVQIQDIGRLREALNDLEK